jgi:hypothetical protein
VDGVLWPAVHQALGAYLRLEDPANRAALLNLALVGGVITVVQGDPSTGFDLSACLIRRDPVRWVQDVADLVTRVAVGWKVQGLDPAGLPITTDATEQVVDTDLTTAADAADVASRVLARTAPEAWRADGLVIDDDYVTPDPDGVALVLDLLDGTSRIGAPIVLGDLPYWSPAGADAAVYLEGGAYRFTGGRWVLDLNVSSASGLGQSAAWDQLDPTWTWNQWDPALTWNDLRGVSAAPGG